MKKFNNFNDAMKWIEKDIIKKGSQKAIPVIAEQIYKDSNEFTYRESGSMYQSGEMHSQFKDGLVIERTPYVRRRYYEGGTPGAGNKNAQPRWFEKTFDTYKDDYQKMLVNSLNEAKKG